VVDRKKDMIKTGGENVASREVEEMIYRLPAVSEVAVIGLPDPKWVEAGDGGDRGQGRPGADRGRGDRALQRPHGALQGAQTRGVHRHLPKNPSGKLLKRELRQRYAAT
jgi:fatty-acyl-CoA synthase